MHRLSCRKLAWLLGFAAGVAGIGAQAQIPETNACLILPYDIVELAVPVDGIVSELEADRGDRINADQVVARLDSAMEEVEYAAALLRSGNSAAIDSAQARLDFLQTEATRSDELVQRNVAAQRVREESQMGMNVARADLEETQLARQLAEIEVEQVETRLRRKIVRSPIAGVVTRRDGAVGEFRAAGAALMTIARTDLLRIEAIMAIAHYPAISLGQHVSVLPEAPFDTAKDGAITVIDQVFDAATGTFGIVAVLENADESLPAGLRCILRFN